VHLTGTPGDDSFAALPGTEYIDALGGNDSITFDFKLVDATLSWVGNTIIVDTATSHTVISGFEVFRFTDGTVNNNDGDPRRPVLLFAEPRRVDGGRRRRHALPHL